MDKQTVILMPSLILGVVIGHQLKRLLDQSSRLRAFEAVEIFVATIAIFAGLTFLAFRTKSKISGLTPDQFRLAWIGAFLVGAIGMPIIYEIANR